MSRWDFLQHVATHCILRYSRQIIAKKGLLGHKACHCSEFKARQFSSNTKFPVNRSVSRLIPEWPAILSISPGLSGDINPFWFLLLLDCDSRIMSAEILPACR